MTGLKRAPPHSCRCFRPCHCRFYFCVPCFSMLDLVPPAAFCGIRLLPNVVARLVQDTARYLRGSSPNRPLIRRGHVRFHTRVPATHPSCCCWCCLFYCCCCCYNHSYIVLPHVFAGAQFCKFKTQSVDRLPVCAQPTVSNLCLVS